MASVLGPIGLILLVVVAALWVHSLVIAVLDKTVTTDKDVNVTVRFLPWPRIEIAVKCTDNRVGDQEGSDRRAPKQQDG